MKLSTSCSCEFSMMMHGCDLMQVTEDLLSYKMLAVKLNNFQVIKNLLTIMYRYGPLECEVICKECFYEEFSEELCVL